MCYFLSFSNTSPSQHLSHAQHDSLSACCKLRTISTLYCARACLINTLTIYVVLGLNDVLSLREAVGCG